MNSQISGQKTSVMKETEYLGMLMDAHLTFENHMDTVKLKLNIANYINPVLLRTRYYAIFESHLDMDVNIGEEHKHKS